MGDRRGIHIVRAGRADTGDAGAFANSRMGAVGGNQQARGKLGAIGELRLHLLGRNREISNSRRMSIKISGHYSRGVPKGFASR